MVNDNKTFEKQFPSLKGKLVYSQILEDDERFEICTGMLDRPDIQNHCLDKQIVKDAYSKHLSVLLNLPVNRQPIIDFIEELGLD